MKVLFIGDVVGRCGRTCVRDAVPVLCKRHGIDIVIANGENAAGGLGATPKVLSELLNKGVAAITLGNHTWRQKELAPALNKLARVVRPANYPAGVPGRGAIVVELANGTRVGVVNLVGRVYMDPVDCPFTVALREVEALRLETPVVLVDFHAEATSEKVAMGWFLDGRCSAVVGTHTHIQTADERVLPKGTAYITDVGMTGPQDSVLGVERELVIKRFLTGMPVTFKVAGGRPVLCGVVIDIEERSGRARTIERVQEPCEER
ncbi:MAG TPA: TIGR00282 family metallophosphoesterase [Candidatus Hydrogenedentes bacterium]|nr:TIGR00282 family metallophosphoesterase [Candidatus Hydrogenedentota bacterium]